VGARGNGKRNSRLMREIKEYGIFLAGDKRILEEL